MRKKLRAKVTFSYTPEQPDELELKLGDIIEIESRVCAACYVLTQCSLAQGLILLRPLVCLVFWLKRPRCIRNFRIRFF